MLQESNGMRRWQACAFGPECLGTYPGSATSIENHTLRRFIP